jgi:hypothetical protein
VPARPLALVVEVPDQQVDAAAVGLPPPLILTLLLLLTPLLLLLLLAALLLWAARRCLWVRLLWVRRLWVRRLLLSASPLKGYLLFLSTQPQHACVQLRHGQLVLRQVLHLQVILQQQPQLPSPFSPKGVQDVPNFRPRWSWDCILGVRR